MHTLFNIDLNIHAGIIKDPSWVYIRDMSLKSLNTFTRYYKDNTTSVKSNHLIVKLLQNIAVSQTLDLDKYYNSVDSMSDNLAMAMGFTSSISKGRIFNNVFYGKNSDEIIISIDTPVNPTLVDKYWTDVSAVRVIKHDRTNLALNPLRGEDNYANELAVITINIPMLAVQYRAFRNHEHNSINEYYDNERSVMQFVAMYVLPNMLVSHLDHAILNRFSNKVLNLSSDAFSNSTPFYQTDLTSKIDKVQVDLINKLINGKIRFDTALKSILTISKDSAFDLLKLPDVAPTRQVLWALVISRLKMLKTLLVIDKLNGSNENQSSKNTLLLQARFYQSDKSMSYNLPSDIFRDVKILLDEIVMLAS